MSTFSYQTPVQFWWKWILYKLTLVSQSGWPLPRVPLNQGGPPCSSPAWPPGPRQGWATGSDRSRLLELRVSRTFPDQLRPQLLRPWIPNLEQFTFASATCNPQPRIHGLQFIGVFPSRVAAKVHSLEASAPGCPQAAPAFPRSKPQSGRQEGSATARLSPRRGWKRLLLTCLRVLGADAPRL